MSFLRSITLVSLLLMTTASVASAQDLNEDDPTHRASITFSPLHLIFPFFEVTGELAVSDHMGIAGIFGLGSVDDFTVIDIGAQFVGYIVGDFDHGMQLGVECLWVQVTSDGIWNSDISVFGEGLAISPLVGYKIAASFGLTFNIQAGIAIMALRGQASDSTSTVHVEQSVVSPMANLNLGWSF